MKLKDKIMITLNLNKLGAKKKMSLAGLPLALGVSMLMHINVYGSLDNLEDYSEFGSSYSGAGSTYLSDTYSAQMDQSGFAAFSWDTVPRAVILRSGSRMSDDAVERIANAYSLVVLEKSNSQGLASTEEGVIDLATRLKAVNPNVKNLFYWNTFYRWDGYEANVEFDEHLVEWTRTAGVPDSMGRYRYVHNNSDFRDWWVASGLAVAMNSAVDGVFLDTLDNWEGRYFNDDGSTVTEYSSYWKYGHTDMVNELVKQLPSSKLMIGNGGTYNHEPNGGREWLRILDGTYTEAWERVNSESIPAQTQADGTAINMQLLREAAVKNKTILFRSSPDHNTQFTNDPEPAELSDRLDWVERNVYYPLAVFLMIAEENSFFHFSDGVYAGTGENDWHIWDTSYMEIFEKPLGAPLGAPVKNGYLYTRSFVYLDVSVNVETGETTFDWKDSERVEPVALGKVTAQSTTVHGGVASRAVDGNTSGVWGDGSVTHTASEENPWWEVDLGANYSIRAIQIFNRSVLQSRLSDFTVSLINSSGAVTYSQTFSDYPDPSLVINTEGAVGHTVRVQLNETGILSLAEVEVYGGLIPYVNIRKRNALEYALDGSGNESNGQNVYLWSYAINNPNQQWEEIDRGNGYYSYQKKGTNYSLDGGSGGANNQNVNLWTTSASNYNQHWKKVDMGNGYFQLQKRNALGFCLNGGSGGANSQNVNLWSSSSSSYNLQWLIEEQ
ncbi:putative glycoside hydrolase [Pontiellaceae bacterium B12219]|nr:putative glycoside hydrolase [Pontiellaceae bacterium B12219]